MSSRSRASAAARTALLARLLSLALVFVVLLAPTALAHIPRLPAQGPSLETATSVDDPSTSWVYYGRIAAPGDTWFYRFELEAGERIYLQVITPDRNGFSPSLALIGPGLEPQGQPPDGLEAPEGLSIVVVAGEQGEAEYEPFTPGAYSYPATIDRTAPADGAYYAAVFAREASGPFGLAVGFEERYTLPSWVKLPIDLARIYAWDGGWAMTLAPPLAVILVGGLLVWGSSRRGRRRGLPHWLASAAGLLYLASAAVLLAQLIRAGAASGPDKAMGITGGFIAAALVMGGTLLWLGRGVRGESPEAPAAQAGGGRQHGCERPAPRLVARVGLFIVGLAGLGLLSGFLLGPALALIGGLAPPYRR